MAPRKRKKSAPAATLPPQLAIVNLHTAGVYVGAEEHWAAVPACDDAPPIRRFGAGTAALEALADWLWDGGITTVALERFPFVCATDIHNEQTILEHLEE